MTKTVNMTQGKPVTLLISFALPLMFGNIFQQLYTVVDTAIVGQGVGLSALAALGSVDWFNWMMMGIAQGYANNKATEDLYEAYNSIGSYNLVALLCGLIAFFTIVIFSTQKRFKMGRLIPFIIGIATGYAAAAIFTVIGNAANIEYLQIIDFAPVVKNFEQSGIAAWLNVPDFALLGAGKELINGELATEIVNNQALSEGVTPTLLNAGGIVEVIVAFLPVALVVFAEHIADHKNLGTIIGKDLIKEPGLKNTLLGDGVGSIAGTVMGICPNTTYGESVGCVAITGNASVVTITTTAIMCIVLSFISPLMAILRTIPSCVMGGVCLTLYGFIAVSGLKMFKHVDLENNKNLFVVSAILISGIGGLAIQIPYAFSDLGAPSATITVTAIATALIIGIVTNAVLGKVENSKLGKGSDETASEE